VITLLDVATDYDGWQPDAQTMRDLDANQFPARLQLVPSE
jgi:hypothetical protein